MNRIRDYVWAAAIVAMAVLPSGAAEQNQNNLALDKKSAKNPKTCRSSDACGFMTTPLRLEVDLKPLHKAAAEPRNDGDFAYSVEIANSSPRAIRVDVWAEVELPGGLIHDPILLKRNLKLPAGLIATQQVEQPLPKNPPAGAYTINLQMGTYPDVVLAGSKLTFERQPDDSWELKSGSHCLRLEGRHSKPASLN